MPLTFKVIVVRPANQLIVVHEVKLVSRVEGPGADDTNEAVHVEHVTTRSSYYLSVVYSYVYSYTLYNNAQMNDRIVIY